MSDFDDLVEEAEQVPIEGWDFGWLDGRAVEERPTWRYFDRVVRRPDLLVVRGTLQSATALNGQESDGERDDRTNMTVTSSWSS